MERNSWITRRIVRRFNRIAPLTLDGAMTFPDDDGWQIHVIYTSSYGRKYAVQIVEPFPYIGNMYKLLGDLDTEEIKNQKLDSLGISSNGGPIGANTKIKRKQSYSPPSQITG